MALSTTANSVTVMRRPGPALLLVLGLVLAACAGGATDSGDGAITGIDPVTTNSAPTTAATEATSTTTQRVSEGSTTTSAAEQPADDAVLAPDFTLSLGNGGTYVLSEDTRPVYLVFWAEW